MIPAILAALMLAAAVACVVPGRRGRNMTVATAATFMAIAFVCTIPAVYAGLDAVTGHVEIADLVKHSAFVIAVAFLARGVVVASGGRVGPSVLWWSVPVGVLVVQTVAFVLVAGKHGPSDFMRTYGYQPAAAVYSIAHFGYFGITFVGAGIACALSGFRSAPATVRSAVVVLFVGSVASVSTAVLLVTRDLVRVFGRADVAAELNRGYQPLLVLSVLLVAVGLAVPPLAAAAARRRLRTDLPLLTAELGAVRDRLAGDDPALRMPAGLRTPGGDPGPIDRVHRLVVEVRDQMFLHPDAELSDHERGVLRRSEELLGRTDIG